MAYKEASLNIRFFSKLLSLTLRFIYLSNADFVYFLYTPHSFTPPHKKQFKALFTVT